MTSHATKHGRFVTWQSSPLSTTAHASTVTKKSVLNKAINAKALSPSVFMIRHSDTILLVKCKKKILQIGKIPKEQSPVWSGTKKKRMVPYYAYAFKDLFLLSRRRR
jgi:hypothetical protein